MTRYMNILSALLINSLLLFGCAGKEDLHPDAGSGNGDQNQSQTETTDFSMLLDFEGKAEPIDCGKHLVERFIEVPNSNWGRTDKSSSSSVTYPDVCALPRRRR